VGLAGVPGLAVLHHMPGWDEWSKEVARKQAFHGYAALSPHLYSRHGPGRWDDIAAAARAAGGMSDAQVMGDSAGAMDTSRQPCANGKVGIIGLFRRETGYGACAREGSTPWIWGGRVAPGRKG
jgi:carboxymethylenebutenolidase